MKATIKKEMIKKSLIHEESQMESTEKNSCSLVTCGFNVSGKCPAMDILKDPHRETGCIFYKNKNIQTDDTRSE